MEFSEHLNKYLSKSEIDNLLTSLKEKSLRAVLLNYKRFSDEEFIKKFPNVKKHPITPHAYIYDPDEYPLGKSFYHEIGCFYIQEPSAMSVASLLPLFENEIVLDLCAAPGGKTIQASMAMNNTGIILSNDLSRQRAQAIVENAERLGLGNLLITSNDFAPIYKEYYQYFDKIILDAPCSGSGMFKKSEDMVNDWSYNKVLKFAEIQKDLILKAYYMLKPGGILSYSTCSFSYEEDEEVIKYLLDNTDAEIYPILNNKLFYISKEKIGIHLLPNLFPGDGHYICQIRKPGTLIASSLSDNKKNVPFKYPLNYRNLVKYGDFLYNINGFINDRHLNILRNGIKVGEVNNEIIKFDLHYARTINTFEKETNIDANQLKDYLEGNVLNIKDISGYTLLKYKNIPIDIAKGDNRVIKNHYPKGLRRKFI